MAPKQRTSRRAGADAAPVPSRLWAPWRLPYLKMVPGARACIFCFGKLTEGERRKRLVLFENQDAVIMLNRYPYTIGHLMVAPRRHIASPELLERAERSVISDLVAHSVKVMRPLINPSGFNLGANLGRSAGAGRAPGSSITCIGISCRAGKATRIS